MTGQCISEFCMLGELEIVTGVAKIMQKKMNGDARLVDKI
jgi:hypothetical protein